MKKLTIEDVKNSEEYMIGGGESFYTIGEVANILKSTKPTIRAYIREGKIKGQKVTGKWYITEDNLKKYLDGCWLSGNTEL